MVCWGGPDAPEWLGKLLFHLDQQIPCRRLESTWQAEPIQNQPDPHRCSLLRLLDAIFARAGCALRCRHTRDKSLSFGWQPESGGPVRICGSACIFDRPGKLWLHIRRGGSRESVYELLGAICRWCEAEPKWTRRLWRAAALESAWTDPGI